MRLCMPGCLAASAACPTCSTRCASMFGAKHSFTLPTGEHHTERQPKSTTRTSRYVDGKYGAAGNCKRRLDWKLSSMWHYWIEGCLANSHTRFRKYFRVSRARFDKIYESAADSGEFRLNTAEPLFSRAYPEPPPGKHGAQLPKVCPLCIKSALLCAAWPPANRTPLWKPASRFPKLCLSHSSPSFLSGS